MSHQAHLNFPPFLSRPAWLKRPVGMNTLTCFDADAGLKRTSIIRGVLNAERRRVVLHETSIEACDRFVLIPASIDHEVKTAR